MRFEHFWMHYSVNILFNYSRSSIQKTGINAKCVTISSKGIEFLRLEGRCGWKRGGVTGKKVGNLKGKVPLNQSLDLKAAETNEHKAIRRTTAYHVDQHCLIVYLFSSICEHLSVSCLIHRLQAPWDRNFFFLFCLWTAFSTMVHLYGFQTLE